MVREQRTDSGNWSGEDRPHIPDISVGNERLPEAQMRVTLESRGGTGPGIIRLRMLFPKSKTNRLVLCNVSVATKPGGGKSHCPLSDLPLGWDSTGLCSRTCAVCDSGYGLGHRAPLWRPRSVKGRPMSGSGLRAFPSISASCQPARSVICSVLGQGEHQRSLGGKRARFKGRQHISAWIRTEWIMNLTSTQL